MDIDFGSWLTEDLKDYYKDLIKLRDRSEIYSDRVECNQIILVALSLKIIQSVLETIMCRVIF